ncbi:MAG TPA: dihydrolipoyllysine-residue acetyltransferase [Xanthomonadaceae bacterium]|nr:dihydrolipoyllysine-residue acetyltransferase [Xanthomonadaceae bacterium]
MAETREARVPDIGDFEGVPVIEVLVAEGDRVEKDQGLVTLESDKATMEVPAPFAGTVTSLKVKVGDEVAEGALIALIEAAQDADAAAAQTDDGRQEPGRKDKDTDATAKPEHEPEADTRGSAHAAPTRTGAQGGKDAAEPVRAHGSDNGADDQASGPGAAPVTFDADRVLPDKVPYASPAVRLFARELGVDLGKVQGSGRNRRITREDVQGYVKQALAGPAAPGAAAGGGLSLLPWPKVDFSKFGAVEEKPLSRIRKISGANLARNWAMIPHVTQQDEADITQMEAFRRQLGEEHKDVKITPLVFLIKAAVAALQSFPHFNASLDAAGETLVYKKYFHIGIAVDTPDGLVVPVIRECERKGLIELSRELAEISGKARDKKLAPGDMQGGCFSISSLGGIGGTGFTPIVNAPEVAILGVSRSAMKPVWNGKKFEPRLMLPLSLSYDHRVVDGADAARFTRHLAQMLGDLRRLLL